MPVLPVPEGAVSVLMTMPLGMPEKVKVTISGVVKLERFALTVVVTTTVWPELLRIASGALEALVLRLGVGVVVPPLPPLVAIGLMVSDLVEVKPLAVPLTGMVVVAVGLLLRVTVNVEALLVALGLVGSAENPETL